MSFIDGDNGDNFLSVMPYLYAPCTIENENKEMTREEASYILRKFYADGYKSNNYNTLEQALQLAVMCLENFPHWIWVEDELPPKKSKYDYLSINVLATDGKEVYESVYNYDSEDWFTHDMWGLDNISYWMYLPSVEHLKK